MNMENYIFKCNVKCVISIRSIPMFLAVTRDKNWNCDTLKFPFFNLQIYDFQWDAFSLNDTYIFTIKSRIFFYKNENRNMDRCPWAMVSQFKAFIWLWSNNKKRFSSIHNKKTIEEKRICEAPKIKHHNQ